MDSFIAGDTKNMPVNQSLADSFSTPFPVIPKLLKSHPIHQALTAYGKVPEVYIFQLWQTISLVKASKSTNEHFRFSFDNDTHEALVTFDLTHFRRQTHFPSATSRANTTEFTPIPDVPTMLSAVKSLGYAGPLNTLQDFKKSHLPKLWYTLYSIVSSCLSPSLFGADGMTKSSLINFYGIAFDQHFDFAKVVWDQLKITVKGKHRQQKRYIPFLRFLSLVLQASLAEFPDLQPTGDCLYATITKLRFVHHSAGINFYSRLTKPLRQYIHRDDPAYIHYRETLDALEEPEIPQAPAQQVHRTTSEGLVSRKRKRGHKGEGSSKTKKSHRQTSQEVQGVRKIAFRMS